MVSAKFAKILVVRTDRIGDVVLTTPVFKALRQAHPQAHISVLLKPSTVDLVQGNPYINELIVDDRLGRNQGVLGFLRLARDIRQRHFDTVFVLHTKRRYNLACFFAGIPDRWGYKNNKLGWLLTRPLKDTRHLSEKHEAEYCLDVLKAAGIGSAGLDLLLPVQKEAELWAAGWLQAHGLKPGEMIALHPSASDSTKQWPVSSFSQLASALGRRYEFKTILIGAQETKAAAAEIVRSCPSVIDLTGQTSLAQMVALLRRCRLLVSNDSGPMHVGAAAGVGVIGLFLRNQPGINADRWRPLGPKAYMLANKDDEAVQLDQKGRVHSGRLDSITVEQVMELAEDIITQDNQSLFYW